LELNALPAFHGGTQAGGTPTCKTSRKGTMFRLELTALTSIGIADDSVARSLGRRASG
jgi:hypothetical protein